MKDRDIIRQMHAEAPPRSADDPLREFLSTHVLRDHARLMKLVLRKLHIGERVKDGDLRKFGTAGDLQRVNLPWWRRGYKVSDYVEHFRIE